MPARRSRSRRPPSTTGGSWRRAGRGRRCPRPARPAATHASVALAPDVLLHGQVSAHGDRARGDQTQDHSDLDRGSITMVKQLVDQQNRPDPRKQGRGYRRQREIRFAAGQGQHRGYQRDQDDNQQIDVQRVLELPHGSVDGPANRGAAHRHRRATHAEPGQEADDEQGDRRNRGDELALRQPVRVQFASSFHRRRVAPARALALRRAYISRATSSCIALKPPTAIAMVASRPMNAPIFRSAPSGKSTVRNAATRIAPTTPSRKAAAETKENSSALSVSASSAGSAATITVISR